MQPDQDQHVIVHNSYGTARVLLCTVANARAILESFLTNLDPKVRQLAEYRRLEQKPVHLVNTRIVTNALKELVSLEIGAPARHLRQLRHGAAPRAVAGQAVPDTRPEEFVTKAFQDEVVLWAFSHKLDAAKLGDSLGYELAQYAPHESLSFMDGLLQRAQGKPLQYAQPEVLDAADELHQLLHGTWKADAKESRVVARYLDFVREHLANSRNDTFEVTRLEAAFT